MHHTIQQNKKKWLGRIWLRARTPSPDSVFCFPWPCCVPCVYCSFQFSSQLPAPSSQPSAPSSQRRALIGLSPSSYSPRPSALSPEISAFNHHACTLGSPPWGGRASKYRLRARGGFFLLFSLLAMVWHTIAKKIKSGLRQIGCAR